MRCAGRSQPPKGESSRRRPRNGRRSAAQPRLCIRSRGILHAEVLALQPAMSAPSSQLSARAGE
jgi:hypothetical protein